MAGWPAGWLVGKSDFNENPVVSPYLDLDLGFVNIDHLSPVENETGTELGKNKL